MNIWQIDYTVRDGWNEYPGSFFLRAERLDQAAAVQAAATYWCLPEDGPERQEFVAGLLQKDFAFFPGEERALTDLSWSPAPTITLNRGDGALKAVIGIPEGITVRIEDWDAGGVDEQASPSRRSPPGKGRSGMYPRLPDRQGGNGFSVPSLFMCSGAMKNQHKPPGVRAGPASCCGKGLGRAPAPGEDEPMKKWVFDGARQFRRFLKPRRGKVILTRHACGKMCEYFLDQETVYDVYRYGEEIKKHDRAPLRELHGGDHYPTGRVK